MADQKARSIYYLNSTDKDDLAVQYGALQGTIAADFVTQALKNTDYLGGQGVKGGTIRVRRLKNATVNAYGTARAASAGGKIQNNGVDVKIDTDKEIAEELNGKDVALYNTDGIGAVLESRRSAFATAMGQELENAYFVALQTGAYTVDVSASTTIEDKVSQFIRYAEAKTSENVMKVNRKDLVLILAPEFYDNLQKYILTLPNPIGGGADIKAFRGVEVLMGVRQGVDATLQYRGSVAQPVVMGTPRIDQIPLSDEKALYFPFYYGTKVVLSDLVFKCALGGADISA